jgi:predicted O-methyltransferase YrrM/ribosomal protein S18 acetylase RimI-like enzyme
MNPGNRDLAQAIRTIADPRAAAVLARLHGEADRQNATLVRRFAAQIPRLLLGRPLPWAKLEPRLADMYLALDPASGTFVYLLARALRARRVVEFGTSFGISTIYLALAVRDNGGGQVVSTELVPEKAARARAHLEQAGLADLVEIRVGDACQTLRRLEGPVDLLLNDGFPRFTLPVLQLVAPHMRSGAVALCGNAVHFPADHVPYRDWVRDPANGFRSAHIDAGRAGELSIKVATPAAAPAPAVPVRSPIRSAEIRLCQVRPEDGPRLEAIRRDAFAPVRASFRSILGDEIYDLAQRREDDAQQGLLASLMAADSAWTLYVARSGDEIVGFVAIRLDGETQVGEIGLNAVDPAHAGQGVGTAMYALALARMKGAGMKVATVATGGDPSHAPARRAYRKAGFEAEIPSVWMCRRL